MEIDIDYWEQLTAEGDKIAAEYEKLSTDDRSAVDKALKIWNQARFDLHGTLVDVYLRSHGVIPTLDTCSAIRFHPKYPFARDVRVPCMIALYSDIMSDMPKAVHLTPLNEDGTKLLKSPYNERRIDSKVIGPYRGCAIKLSGQADLSSGLTIGDSVENTLAHIAKVSGPAWAVTDANEMACFPVLPGIKRLTLLEKRFDKTDLYVTKCAERWIAAGVRVLKVPGRFITANLTLVSDAKARTKRFAICDGESNPVWCASFFESNNIAKQSYCEMDAAKKAVWLASKIKEEIGADVIQLTLKCNAAGDRARALGGHANWLNVVLEVVHIPGLENPARPLVDAREFKNWHDNDFNALVNNEWSAIVARETERRNNEMHYDKVEDFFE